MFKNYLLSSLRIMARNSSFTFINLFGLAIGLSCFFLITIFIQDELSYDKHQSKADRIYRLRYLISEFDLGRVPPIFKEHINDFFPEVEASARLFSRSVSVTVRKEDGSEKRYEEDNVNFSDSEFLSIFDLELVNGSLDEALDDPFTVILNQEIAEKYFPGLDPIGKTVTMEGESNFEVIAVVKDFPPNTHTHFQMLVPYDNMYDIEPVSIRENIRANFQQNWMVSHSPTYILLKEGEDVNSVNDRFADWVSEKIPENMNKGQSFELQPLLDIHLNNAVSAQSEPSGSPEFLWIFGTVGLLTLIIACINYINLSTAKSLQRGKEIAMRKVLGARRMSVGIQFLAESFLVTLFASFFALLFSLLFLPLMNGLTGKELEGSVFMDPIFILGFLLITIITGLLAGVYPSIFVSGFPPLKNIQSRFSNAINKGANLSFRRVLIVIQFSISILLISSTLVIYQQFQLFKDQELGFNKESMVTARIQSQNFNSVFGGVDEQMRNKLNSFENEIASIPGVKASTLSSVAPGFGMVSRNIIPEGFTSDDHMLCAVMSIDYDFIPTYEIELLEGRNFGVAYGTDHTSAFIINESAVEEFQFGSPEEAIGKEINIEGKEGKVVGVVADFNFQALTEALRPLVLEIFVPQFNTFSMRLENQNARKTLGEIEGVWNKFFPTETFDYRFLDEALLENYESQERFGQLIGYFAFLAILISCLGSYGMILFIASQKEKEIGIRKVLGASIAQIVMMLNNRFSWLVVISVVLAWPMTYYLTNLWLEDFSYRVEFSIIPLILGALVTLGLVFLTVSLKSVSTALLNPAQVLKRE